MLLPSVFGLFPTDIGDPPTSSITQIQAGETVSLSPPLLPPGIPLTLFFSPRVTALP